MTTATAEIGQTAKRAEEIFPVLAKWQADQVDGWLELTYRFRLWHRKQIVMSDASPDLVEADRRLLKHLILFTRLMVAATDDPDGPPTPRLPELQTTLALLRDEWQCLYAPERMSNQEAEAVLHEVFPG